MQYKALKMPLLAIGMMVAAPTLAAQIVWTDWVSASASGASGNLGGVTVTIDNRLHNWQVTGGTDYWRQGGVTPWAAYDGVSNLPLNNDFVAPNGNGAVHKISFSSAIIDPYIAVISLGRTNVNTSWDFDAAFSIVDQGRGFWGNGALVQVGNQLSAGEGHGIIQFKGVFTEINLTTDNVEFWSGLSIGAAVPEPATWAMLISGFGLVGFAARRRREASVSA